MICLVNIGLGRGDRSEAGERRAMAQAGLCAVTFWPDAYIQLN